MAVALVKFHSFIEACMEGKHNFASDTLKYAFTDTEPSVSADAVLADVAGTIVTTNMDTITATGVTSTQTGGTFKLVIGDLLITAGGALDQFQYVVLYNDDAPSDEVIGYYDYGSAVNMVDTNTFNIDNDPIAGVFTNT